MNGEFIIHLTHHRDQALYWRWRFDEILHNDGRLIATSRIAITESRELLLRLSEGEKPH